VSVDATALVTRAEVEDFLYHESALLDAWELDAWLELMHDQVRYVVPSTDRPHGDTAATLALIDDDSVRLRARVRRLLDPQAHREYPHPRTRRLVTNVRIVEQLDRAVVVNANFVVYRLKRHDVVSYMGRYVHHLVRDDAGALRFMRRRAELDLEALRPHGTVSIIL
jgi:p-cumate 2,3-dioxygenase beta subunit